MKQPVFEKPLGKALQLALDYLDGLDAERVLAAASPAELRARLGGELPPEGLPAESVVAGLAAAARRGLLGSAGGRFFGWVIGGSLPGALAADWLTSAWDQNPGTYACAPAAAVAEEVAGEWLKEIFGLPVGASFAFVTGCQMAHVTCLAAARNALLSRCGWDVEEEGLSCGPAIRILTSKERHGTIERAVRLLGLGRSNLVGLSADGEGRLQPAVLEEALLEAPGAPAIVVLQAGTVNGGAYDPFERLVPLAKRHGAWVHVDGAFGLWAAASPRYRHLLEGAARADSWAADGHKWLNVPYDCGYAFVADAEAHRAAMSHRAAYLAFEADARDPIDWTPEHSRRARGFPTYAALRELGREGVAALVERCCEHADALVSGLAALPGVELLLRPVINQGLVRFRDPSPLANEQDHDRRTEETIAAVQKGGEAFFTGTVWQGRRAMRISVSNWRTSPEDVKRAIGAVRSAPRIGAPPKTGRRSAAQRVTIT